MSRPVRLLSWYRIELGPTGALLSCSLVERAGTDAGVEQNARVLREFKEDT